MLSCGRKEGSLLMLSVSLVAARTRLYRRAV